MPGVVKILVGADKLLEPPSLKSQKKPLEPAGGVKLTCKGAHPWVISAVWANERRETKIAIRVNVIRIRSIFGCLNTILKKLLQKIKVELGFHSYI